MTVKLHRCSATWVKIGGHPCWRAQRALDEAGVDYELVLHSGLRFRRPEVAELTGGPKALPVVEFEDGSILRESAVIAERARSGTLMPERPTAAPEAPTAAPEQPAAPSATAPEPPAGEPAPPAEPGEGPQV